MDKVKKIQENLMEELGLENLSLEKKQELAVKMTEVALKKVFSETMEKLKEEDKKNYKQMVLEGKSPEEIDEFLAGKISNYEQLVDETINNFKEEIKNNF